MVSRKDKKILDRVYEHTMKMYEIRRKVHQEHNAKGGED